MAIDASGAKGDADPARDDAWLTPGDAFAPIAHVKSQLVFEGADRRHPRLTIAITTYRRGALLIEAVRSAVEQDWGEPFEVIVVDNDPESVGAAPLLEALPQLADSNFRYYVNAENVGMFGNWNRSIELARAEWYTMLHDDDLFEPNFASRMMPILDGNQSIEGLACRRTFFGPHIAPRRKPLRVTARAIGTELRFGGRRARRFRARRYFWWATNPVGLIVRPRDCIALGGYQPDEWPSSDYYFQLRFAIRHRLFECRDYLVRIRAEENESFRPETAMGIVVGAHVLRGRMAGTVVPRWWGRLSTLILERQRHLNLLSTFGVSREMIEKAAGVKLPRDRPALFIALKGLFGGY